MTSLMTVKLGRDIRVLWPRLVSMVFAIAVSLAAVGAVLFAWTASSRESSAAYASTEPASATILLDQGISVERMAAIVAAARERPDVIETAGRAQFSTTVEVDGIPREIPLQVFLAAPDDPMRVANFEVEHGGWPPKAGEIFLGRDSLALLGIAVGDTVRIVTPAGDPVSLRISDTVYDPSLSPAPQEQTARAYLSTASMPGPVLLDQLKIQVADPGRTAPTDSRDTAAAVAGDLGSWLQRQHGLPIREIQVPEPNAHPHQWQADALLSSLLAGGAAALLLSSLLVANMLNNVFTQQIPQIGIMKAIGARSRRIAGLYLTLTLLVACSATLLAFGPAVLLGRVAVATFLGFLGIQPANLTAPWWTYVVVIAVGLGLPLVMALVPLIKASRTTVRAAIDHHGSGSPARAYGVAARLGRVPGLDRSLLLALRNTVRRPTRFLLSAGLLASAGMVFVAGMSLSSGTAAIADEQKAERTWDVDVQLARPVPVQDVTTLVAGLPGVSGVEGWNVTPAGVAGPGEIPVTRTYPDQGHGSVTVTALPPGTAATLVPPKLLSGRWLAPGETGAIVLNQITRDATVPDVRPGDAVQLIVGGRPTTWRVVGIVEERSRRGGAYTTAEGFGAATGRPPAANQLRVTTASHDEQARQQAANAVEQALTGAGIEVRSVASISRSEAISAGHLGPVILILLGIALPLGVIGVIGLASTMSANVLERTREFGIMHAIGARPRMVRRIVVAEGVFLTLASCLAAAIPALALTAILGAGLGNLFFSAPLPYRISPLAAGIWLAAAVLGALLATEGAAARASRLTVREALAYL